VSRGRGARGRRGSTRVGSDTGGTFTDLVGDDGRVVKVPSTPDDPGRAVAQGLDELAGLAGTGAGRLRVLTHGTTVGTNALLERRGATVALVTNEGLRDLIEIGRQDRPSLYDQSVDRPVPLVDRAHRYEVVGRLDATGAEIQPVQPGSIGPLAADVEAVAVVLLHADHEPAHEVAVAEALTADGWDVTTSHEVAPEFREFERTVTTVINASLRPVCRTYLHGIEPLADEVLVMTSAGGLVPVAQAADRPVGLLLSGPAGGVLAGAHAATVNGWPDAITFDMGGTSTDVCLVLDGQPAPAAEREVAGFPVRSPALDVHTIGAGGGSIARIDAGGALVVGPRSAGAVPGPACYGRGGADPTVTDADLAAGRIPAAGHFPGIGSLDVAAARAALDEAGVTAEGVLAVVDASMEQALRAVSIERGVDPRNLALVAFGGAGPLHACSLAEALGMAAVIVPARAGVLSAVGILGAPRQVDLVESCPDPLDHADARRRSAHLAIRAARQALGDDGPARADGPSSEVVHTFDCRYEGQSHELSVHEIADFHDEHERRNGYHRPDWPIEVIAVRVSARVPSPVAVGDLPPVSRAAAVGPVVIAEPDCTIWVPDGWRADPGVEGALVLTRAEGRR
jgi:N-methylhydantoinase A/oxoprolinase/acetone carboxylase beta subunit